MSTVYSLKLKAFWRSDLAYWGAILLLVGGAYWDAIWNLIDIWQKREEYSHGFFIPLIAGYLVWRQRTAWPVSQGHGLGVQIATLAVILLLAGELATTYLLVHYGLVTFILGAFIARYGLAAFRQAWMPLGFLYFMIPLPPFLHNQISLKMQLWSSKLGVGFIELCRIPVYLEGNVIDLGIYQLQVAEACNGLRYLFPLFSLSFLFAYVYRGPIWQRWMVFLSAAPLSILLNSFRIGAIGLLVNRWGIGMAEGFLHYFEGWLVFMACVALLLLEIRILAWLKRDLRPIGALIDMPEVQPASNSAVCQAKGMGGLGVVLGAALIGAVLLQQREEIIPQRKSFIYFPLQIAEWQGKRGYLDKVYLDALKLSDYFLAEYVSPRSQWPVSLYIAYYESQHAGSAAHSPRSCIPGGGWEIQSLERHLLKGVELNGHPLQVNRMLIAKGEDKQLVYYWFQQRGRNLVSEYAVKWFLLSDALVKRRTDGALVRLVTPINVLTSPQEASARIESFMRLVLPLLPAYVPD